MAQDIGSSLDEFFSKEAYLESLREVEFVNNGERPVTGLVQEGGSERKKICEDVKLKDPEKGLFLVADGVSTGKGWFASRETARHLQERLGEDLDRSIVANVRIGDTNTTVFDRIDTEVRSTMLAALVEAHNKIAAAAVANPELRGAGTTASVVKLVDMPTLDGEFKQRMFISSVGDSRVYLVRNNVLYQLTRDDSMLNLRVDRGELTQEQAQVIDQAALRAQIPADIQKFAGSRNVITAAVGVGRTDSYSVQAYDVQAGDRIVITSDGVHDQMLEQEIRDHLNSQSDDILAERSLQTSADDIAGLGKKNNPRAKGDDIAALVHTIEAHGPDRSYLRDDVQRNRKMERLQATITESQRRAVQEGKRRIAMQQRLEKLPAMTPKKQRLSYELTEARSAQQEAHQQHIVVNAQLDLLDVRIPPKLTIGKRVVLEPFAPGTPPDFADVVAYDEKTHEYVLRSDVKGEVRKPRYQTETIQPRFMANVGDMVSVLDEESGERVDGFTVIAQRKDGKVELIKTHGGQTIRVVRSVKEISNAVWRSLMGGEKKRTDAITTKERNDELEIKIERLEQQQLEVVRLDARFRAEMQSDLRPELHTETGPKEIEQLRAMNRVLDDLKNAWAIYHSKASGNERAKGLMRMRELVRVHQGDLVDSGWITDPARIDIVGIAQKWIQDLGRRIQELEAKISQNKG